MPGSTPPTLYDALTLDHEILEGEDWSVDTFGTLLDFALLTQILHVPVVLQSPNYDGPLPDLPAANQVTGWAACKDVMDPGNAGT